MIKNEKEEEYNLIIMDDGKMNALDIDTLNSIYDSMDKTRVNIITGNERVFSAGANINNFLNISDSKAFDLSISGHDILDKIENFPMPVISAMDGYVFGGGLELALSTDFRIAGKNLKLGFPEVNLGILPGWGGTQRLKNLIGKNKAEYLIMTGRSLNSQETLDYGIINDIYENYLEKSIDLAKELYYKSWDSLKNIKILMNHGSFYEESKLFGELFNTKNMQIGVSSFLQKKKPEFNK